MTNTLCFIEVLYISIYIVKKCINFLANILISTLLARINFVAVIANYYANNQFYFSFGMHLYKKKTILCLIYNVGIKMDG